MLEANAAERPLRLAGMALALVVAATYLVIALGLVADDFESPSTPVMALAAVAYLVGGFLITRADWRLLLLGAVINFVVLIIFLGSWMGDNATVDVLTVVGKMAQIGLGILLLWLVFRGRETRRAKGST